MKLTAHLSTPWGWKAELALLAHLQWTAYPYKWSAISCRSSADQWKFADQRPTFYHWATQPTIYIYIYIYIYINYIYIWLTVDHLDVSHTNFDTPSSVESMQRDRWGEALRTCLSDKCHRARQQSPTVKFVISFLQCPSFYCQKWSGQSPGTKASFDPIRERYFSNRISFSVVFFHRQDGAIPFCRYCFYSEIAFSVAR